jgi:hypothetical protein
MLTNQKDKHQIQIVFGTETWIVEGEESQEEENLLNLLDDGLMLVIEAREYLARVRYNDFRLT